MGYTTVNPADCKQRSGNLKLVLKHKFPLILGQDFAGEVVSVVNTTSAGFTIGDLVFGCTAPNNGCSAEYVVADVDQCAKLVGRSEFANEDNSHFELLRKAVACPTAFCTAWKGLFVVGGMRRREQTNYCKILFTKG